MHGKAGSIVRGFVVAVQPAPDGELDYRRLNYLKDLLGSLGCYGLGGKQILRSGKPHGSGQNERSEGENESVTDFVPTTAIHCRSPGCPS
jgi:hypothetical protein